MSLLHAYMCVFLLKETETTGASIFLIVLLCVSQMKAIWRVSKSLPLQKKDILQSTERNCRIT